MSFQAVSALAESHQPTRFPSLKLKAGRSALIELVTAVRHLLPVRLNDGAILALEDLMSKTRPSDWTSEDREPVCYAQACEVAKGRGVGSGQNMGVMRRVFCLRRSADHRELRPL